MNIEASTAVKKFHFWLNYRSQRTITSLEIVDLGSNKALNQYGSLERFVSGFPQLKYLKLRTGARTHYTDLAELLQSCRGGKLEKLVIRGHYGTHNTTIMLVETMPEDWTNTALYDMLKNLESDNCGDISVNTLEIILTKLKNVKKLMVAPFTSVRNYKTQLQLKYYWKLIWSARSSLSRYIEKCVLSLETENEKLVLRIGVKEMDQKKNTRMQQKNARRIRLKIHLMISISKMKDTAMKCTLVLLITIMMVIITLWIMILMAIIMVAMKTLDMARIEDINHIS